MHPPGNPSFPLQKFRSTGRTNPRTEFSIFAVSGSTAVNKGRQVYLFDQVNKVVQLLDKFKAVGDVVANVDPVHVGLPWAGIRAIL